MAAENRSFVTGNNGNEELHVGQNVLARIENQDATLPAFVQLLSFHHELWYLTFKSGVVSNVGSS